MGFANMGPEVKQTKTQNNLLMCCCWRARLSWAWHSRHDVVRWVSVRPSVRWDVLVHNLSPSGIFFDWVISSVNFKLNASFNLKLKFETLINLPYSSSGNAIVRHKELYEIKQTIIFGTQVYVLLISACFTTILNYTTSFLEPIDKQVRPFKLICIMLL